MKIALIGYGKMGKEIERIALSRGHEVVCIIDINNQEDFASEAFRSADVAIEFTNPGAAYGNCLRAMQEGVKLVSGSTGWMAEHGEEIRRLCTEEGKTLFWSSNFSLGVAIFSAVNKYLARIMNEFPTYDVSMTETHHIHKLDAPSGTAITLAEGILENLDRKTRWELASPDKEEDEKDVLRITARPSAKARCRASTASVTTRRRTASPSPTTRRTAAALPWAPCWRPNTPPGIRASWG